MENNQLDSELDISRFLEKFNQNTLTSNNSISESIPSLEARSATTTGSQNHSFERLEEKIQELEEKFSISSAQNQAVLQELAFTRQAVESQKTRDAFLANLAASISNLKASVEALSRNRQTPFSYDAVPMPIHTFDVPTSTGNKSTSFPYQPSSYNVDQQHEFRAAQEAKEEALVQLHTVRLEKEKLQTSLETERSAHEEAIKQLRSEKNLAQAGWEAALAEKDKLSSSWDRERAAKMIELDVARTETTEKTRIIENLQQKASQLKAVNVALDREIKRVQQERTDALRKSAEQAKEILSLRDALAAAEERLKTFNFDGRIISIRREYEQKVRHLESQLQEASATCMKQVEEIEALRAENIRLHKLVEEREQLAALYGEQTQQLHTLQKVSDEKQSLEEALKSLRAKIEENDAVICTLKDQIEVLTRENTELKNRPAAPEFPQPEAPREPVVAHRLTPKHPAVNRFQAKAAVATVPPLPPQTAPVELQNTLRAAIQTDDDLPEIRVAEPMPQEDLYNGEDFLERTDSFIGRMKWSIFREDK